MKRYLGLLLVLLWIVPGTLAQSDTPERIRFATGAISAERYGQISGFAGDDYVLRAFAGQVMQVSVDNAYLTLVSPDGIPLARAQAGAQYASLVLPETGDYRIGVSLPAGSPQTNYRLWVQIVGTPQPDRPIERIQFQPGTSGAVLSDQVTAGSVNRYVLYAFAGQEMQVTLDNANLTVISPTGQILSRASQGTRSLNVTLPETGDYVVEAVALGVTVNYQLVVTIIWPQPAEPQIERIQFETGSIGAQVTGNVSNVDTDRYVLYAFAGQVMQVDLSSAYVTLISPSGIPLARAQAGVQSIMTTLPETGDYTLIVDVPFASAPVDYALNVTITGAINVDDEAVDPIKFARGASSATVYGQISPYDTDRYSLYAFVGQQMNLNLSDGYLTVISPSGQVIVSPQQQTPIATFTLQETGDYIVLVNIHPFSPVIDYSLFVSII